MIKATILNRSVKDFYCVFIFLLLMSCGVYAQKTYTTIKKNVNLTASNFTHQLTTTQDSLVLESDVPFNKVRFLNGNYKKSIEFSGGVYKSKIPLNDLPLGQYTVLFYDVNKIIVFRLARLLPFKTKRERIFGHKVSSAYHSNTNSKTIYNPVNKAIVANKD